MSTTGEPSTDAATPVQVPTGRPLLELSGLKVSFGGVAALRGVDLTVCEGEFVVLLGPNGAGKTTTLRAVSGLARPNGGSIRVGGTATTSWAAPRLARAGLAHVPEARRIFPDHTVLENLQLGGYIHRRRGRVQADTLAEVLALFPRLAERREQPAGTLSGGEAQMLAVGRALMLRPRLLMLDEPSLGLAPRLVAEMFSYLSRLHRDRGLTVLLVEQQATSALTHADRGYVLERGQVALSGTAAALRSDPRVQRVYLGGSLDEPAAG